MRLRLSAAVSSVSIGLVLAACSAPSATGGSTAGNAADTKPGAAAVTTATSKSQTPGAVDPNGPEVVEPGDIPDNQAFVPYASPDGVFTVRVPEGWTRTDGAGTATFTDKYNSITIAESGASSAPTVESVKSAGLSDVAVDPTFKLVDVKATSRPAGNGVVALFEIGSAPNALTHKQALLAVERYVFVHNGKQVSLTLSGAKGADNVDPWKTVSDSLAWN